MIKFSKLKVGNFYKFNYENDVFYQIISIDKNNVFKIKINALKISLKNDVVVNIYWNHLKNEETFLIKIKDKNLLNKIKSIIENQVFL